MSSVSSSSLTDFSPWLSSHRSSSRSSFASARSAPVAPPAADRIRAMLNLGFAAATTVMHRSPERFIDIHYIHMYIVPQELRMKPNIEAFFDPVTATMSYVVYDQPGGRAAVVDAVLDFDPKSGRTGTASADRLLDFLGERKLGLDWIL